MFEEAGVDCNCLEVIVSVIYILFLLQAAVSDSADNVVRSAPATSDDNMFNFESVVPPSSTETASSSSGPPSPKCKASERRGSVRRRKRGFGHGVTSPTESMPWFDKIVSTTLLLRNLIHGDQRGSSQLTDSLAAVISTRSTALQRLLVITNIAPTLSRKEAVGAIRKACRPSGGIHDEVYIPEVESHVIAEEPRSEEDSDRVDSRVKSLTELLPSAQQDKPDRILGYAVVQLKSASQLELVRQALTSSKTLKDPSCAESSVGVAKVNSELLMEGTNELAAFAVFDEFLRERMFNGESGKGLSESARGALAEIFSSCARATNIDVVKEITSNNLEAVQSSASPGVAETTTEPQSHVVPSQDKKGCTNSDKDHETTSRQTAQSSSSEGILTKDQICSLAPGNLLLSFFNAVRHAKESTSELVTQLLRVHGTFVKGSDENVLRLEGFLDWALLRGYQDVRVIWKGVIACGYDLQFNRFVISGNSGVLLRHRRKIRGEKDGSQSTTFANFVGKVAKFCFSSISPPPPPLPPLQSKRTFLLQYFMGHIQH